MKKIVCASLVFRMIRWYARNAPSSRGKMFLATWLSKHSGNLAPIGVREALIHTRTFPIKYRYVANSTVGIWLELFSAWEERHVQRAVQILRSARSPRPVLLDIGANYGLYSITAASHVEHCRCFAFECVPSVCERFRENYELNRAAIEMQGATVTLFEKALSNVKGEVAFEMSPDDGAGSLINSSGGHRITVDAVTGEFIAPLLDGDEIDLCKIDVEGAEALVVEALWPFLRDRRIGAIQVEIAQGNEAVLDAILGCGYVAEDGDVSKLKTSEGREDFFLRRV